MNEKVDLDRHSDGRFRIGHAQPSPGRPRRAVEEKYLAWLREAVTYADWIKIAEKAISQAKAGDKAAREWLSHYLIGKPTEYVNMNAAALGQSFGALLVEVRRSLLETPGVFVETGGSDSDSDDNLAIARTGAAADLETR